jgi:UDP-N-acetylglucosamine transferase subunit ALG13
MILVTTGISGAPFDRLLHALEQIQTDESIFVQHGPSRVRPTGATCAAFLPFGRLNELVAASSTVITHAGAGSVLVALAHGKRPIVVPRLPQYSEVVDDHQLVFARHLAQTNVVTLVEDLSGLQRAVAGNAPTQPDQAAHESALVRELYMYLHSLRATAAEPIEGHVESRSSRSFPLRGDIAEHRVSVGDDTSAFPTDAGGLTP